MQRCVGTTWKHVAFVSASLPSVFRSQLCRRTERRECHADAANAANLMKRCDVRASLLSRDFRQN